MKNPIVTSVFTALAMTCLMATDALAQNPFSIDGTISNTNNSGVPATNPSTCASPSPQACKLNDPSGNVKELGPLNSNTTKVGPIHTDALPTLGFTNPNGQVDLGAVWIQTKEATNGDVWFYFGWLRDANSGSGFISIEMQQSALPTGCVYTGIDQTSATSAASLVANCNPWQNRQSGDFILLWDQSGQDTTIYKRVFEGDPLVLGPSEALGSAEAEFSVDGFRGEAAINLTEDVFPEGGACLSIANMIPNTVTGNSDTADYKDTVLAAVPPISNCGILIVNKVTDVAEAGSFPYTIDRVNGGVLRFPDPGGPTSLGDTFSRALGPPVVEDLGPDTYNNLIAGTDYRITETVPTGWSFVKVECSIDGGTKTTFNANPAASITVESGKTTTCTIYNSLNIASPAAATQPLSSTFLKDFISVTGILRGATETSMSVTFRLYGSLADCQNDTNRLLTETINLTLAAGATTATATTGGTTNGYLVSNGTYYWWARFSGNNLNNPATKDCGSESTTVLVTHSPSGS